MSEVFQRVLGKLICWWSAVSPRLLRLLPNHSPVWDPDNQNQTGNDAVWCSWSGHWTSCFYKVEEHVLLKGYEPASSTSSNHLKGHKQPAHTKWKCLCSDSFSGAWFLSPAARTGAAQTAPPPQGKRRTTARVWQDLNLRLLNLQKAAFLSPLYSRTEFHSNMFLRQHWSISSLAGTSCFAYVVCLYASHCPLLSLPCLEWILLFASLVSMCSVHEGKCNFLSVTQKNPPPLKHPILCMVEYQGGFKGWNKNFL